MLQKRRPRKIGPYRDHLKKLVQHLSLSSIRPRLPSLTEIIDTGPKNSLDHNGYSSLR